MAPEFTTAEILGVRIACLDMPGLLSIFEALLAGARGSRPYLLTYTNSHCLNIAKQDPDYKDGVNRFDLVYADGFGVVMAGRALGICRLEKLTGADWLEGVCQILDLHAGRVFILASEPGVAQRAGRHFREKYPRLEIVGTADGYFEKKSEAEVLAQIRDSQPDVLFVGMGTPLQENWILKHSSTLPVKICWAVGALFEYPAGKLKRAPRWMLALQLEWLWRLIIDPGHTWRRYLLGIPYFFYQVLAAKLKRPSGQ
jgi:N-acetylglucosaminyldiphosphoundecaprenol N-acetyl-beta-D-mannosaminyltransferase